MNMYVAADSGVTEAMCGKGMQLGEGAGLNPFTSMLMSVSVRRWKRADDDRWDGDGMWELKSKLKLQFVAGWEIRREVMASCVT